MNNHFVMNFEDVGNLELSEIPSLDPCYSGPDSGVIVKVKWTSFGISIEQELYFLEVEIAGFCRFDISQLKPSEKFVLYAECGLFKMVFERNLDAEMYCDLWWRFDWPPHRIAVDENPPALKEQPHQYRCFGMPIEAARVEALQRFFGDIDNQAPVLKTTDLVELDEKELQALMIPRPGDDGPRVLERKKQ